MKKFLSRLKASFTTRSFRVGGYSVVAAAIVLAIVVTANLLVQAIPRNLTKLDTTSLKLFTLSAQTEQILSTLEKDITVYWIVQEGYEDTTLSTLLERYDMKSDHITMEKIDPDLHPTFVQTYAGSNASNNTLVVKCGERFRFLSDEDIYAENYTDFYTTGDITYDFAGENALTSAIDYVISDDLPKLYRLTGHGEVSLGTSFTDAIESDNMELTDLSLVTAGSVPEDADAVLILSPQSDISSEEKDMLLTYTQAGGNLLYVSTPPQKEGDFANLNDLMAQYGVIVREGVVVEGNVGNYVDDAPYALLPIIQSHTITDPLKEGGYKVMLPIAQGLATADTLAENLTVSHLLITSSRAYSKIAGLGLETYDKQDGDIDGPFSLAAAVEAAVDSETTARIVWISSPMVLDESTNFQISGGNLDFYMNTLNWMCQYENRISIRVKNLAYEHLTINQGMGTVLTVTMVVILPLSFLAVGIVIWLRRRRK